MAAKFKCCCLRARVVFDECLAEKRRVSPYNAIWWWRQQTLRKLMKNMTRKSWIFWNWQSLPELSDLEKSDLKIRSRSVKKRSTIRSRSWSRKMVKSDLRSDQKVICRSRSWSVDQDRHYFASKYRKEKMKLMQLSTMGLHSSNGKNLKKIGFNYWG